MIRHLHALLHQRPAAWPGALVAEVFTATMLLSKPAAPDFAELQRRIEKLPAG